MSPLSSGSFLNVPQWAQISWGPSPVEGMSVMPEDASQEDYERIYALIQKYFESEYPVFKPEVIVADDKEYFLPVLKALVRVNGKYSSPGYESIWDDMELHAECRDSVYEKITATLNSSGKIVYEKSPSLPPKHAAPEETCECGIYGSVNLQEISSYFTRNYNLGTRTQLQGQSYSMLWVDDRAIELPENVLCIIEPAPDAKVIVCRKGWKASHAFISEIVGETIPVNVASNLLSLAWHRPVDVARLYANR